MIECFPILGQAAASIEPRKGSFDNPSFRNDLEAYGFVGPPDDFDRQVGKVLLHPVPKFWPLISRICKKLLQERKHAEQRRRHENAAIAILDIGRVNDRVQQQAGCVDENVPLFALDLFARIKARRINLSPPFSALFTL